MDFELRPFSWLAHFALGVTIALLGVLVVSLLVPIEFIDAIVGGVSAQEESLTPGVELSSNSELQARLAAALGQPGTVHHIMILGQSLALGGGGYPALSTRYPYYNLAVNDGKLALLREWANESPATSLANTISYLNRRSWQTLMSNHGGNGMAYIGLNKGTDYYQSGIQALEIAKRELADKGRNYELSAYVAIHGESDHLIGSDQLYRGYLETWRNDYNQDVTRIFGKQVNAPMFIDQLGSWTAYDVPTSPIPAQQLSAHLNNPSSIYLIGPRYFLPYMDNLHLNNKSYRLLGEYFGKVMYKVLVQKQSWHPLMPLSTTRNGNKIAVKFHVPVKPLRLDTNLVRAQQNYGFEFGEDVPTGAEPAKITKVEISGSDTVVLTLDKVPSGQNLKIRYAWTGVPGARPGRDSDGSARGNLRDNDRTLGPTNTPLYNWAVHFERAID